MELFSCPVCKIVSCGDTVILVTLDGVVDAYVKLNELVDSALLDLLFIAPELIRNDELTELSSPIAKIVDTHALIACKFMKLLERVTDNGRTEMSYMEGLRNVGGGIVKNDRLSLTDAGRTVILFFVKYLGKNVLAKVLV